jgi:hypothetical protein
MRPGASARHAARRRLLRVRHASGCLGMSHGPSHGSSSTTSRTPRVQVPRHVARPDAWLVVNYFAYGTHPGASARRAARHRLLHVRRASGCLGTLHGTSRGSSSTTSPTPRVRVSRLVARAARRRLLHLRRASGCLCTSHGSSSSSSSTTSRTPRVWVPRHVARLVVDYFVYAACLGTSARHTARHAARRRLLRLHRASGCLGTSRSSSRSSSRVPSSTASRMPRVRVPRHVAWPDARLVVDYFVYAAYPGASARHAAHYRLLRVRCASWCLGTSHGTSRGSSLTTSHTPHVRVSRHVARHVARLVVDYFTYAACPGASACREARRPLLRVRRAPGCLSTSHGSSSTTSRTLHVRVPRHATRPVAWLVIDYFAYVARPGASARRTACRADVRVPRHVARPIARLVVDYFAYIARPGASARRTARRAARHRLLRVRHVSGCLGTSRGSSSTTSRTPRIQLAQHVARHVARLVVDYFTYVARPGASARRAARHAARRRLLRVRRASGFLGTSHDPSRGSSSATSRMPRIRVRRHVVRLVVDTVRPGASTRRAALRQLLRLRRASG